MNRDRPTMVQGMRRRVVRECEWCSRRFEIYHTTDRFCCSGCRGKYWNAEVAKALGRRNAEMGRKNMPPEFVRGMDLDLGKFENPRQIEPRPDFALTEAKHKTEWPEQWQCVHCDKRWPNSTLYCDCPESDKAPSDDF